MTPAHEHKDIIWLKSTKSTNYDLRQLKGELDNLSIIATVEQTAGRGQGDHSWFASPGANLTFSMLMRFPHQGAFSLAASDMIHITHIATLGIYDYLLSKGIESRIKWPNDIWVGERKICGILIENILDAAMISESIVGIGLNVNQEDWPQSLPNPVSMYELSGKRYELKEELVQLKEKICRRFELLGSADGRMCLESDFGALMFKLREERQ